MSVCSCLLHLPSQDFLRTEAFIFLGVCVSFGPRGLFLALSVNHVSSRRQTFLLKNCTKDWYLYVFLGRILLLQFLILADVIIQAAVFYFSFYLSFWDWKNLTVLGASIWEDKLTFWWCFSSLVSAGLRLRLRCN